MTIEERLRLLEDRAKIHELVARYGRVLDDRDFEAVGSLYTEDAIFDTTAGRIVGRKGVVDYYRERMAQFGPTYHYPHSTEIEFAGSGHASGVVAAHAEVAVDGETVWVALRYHDTYRRGPEGWQFYERQVRLLYVSKLSELPQMLADPLRVRWPGTPPQRAALGYAEDE